MFSLEGENLTTTSPDSNIHFKANFPDMASEVASMFTNITTAIVLSGIHQTTAMASVLNAATVWKYSPHQLWTVYGVALSVCALVSILGTIIMLSNGFAGDSSFSSLLRTTRRADLANLDESTRIGFVPSAIGDGFEFRRLLPTS